MSVDSSVDSSSVRRSLRHRSLLLRSVQIRQAARWMFDKTHLVAGTVGRLLAGLVLAAMFVVVTLIVGAVFKLGAEMGLVLAGIALVSVLGASAVLVLWRRDDAALEAERKKIEDAVLALRERAAELKDIEDEEAARREEEEEQRRAERDRRRPPQRERRQVAPRFKPCPYCREEIPYRAMKCRFCHEILDEDLARERRRGSSGVAAVLSFFLPGLGQIYKGQVLSGLVWHFMLDSMYAASAGLMFCCGAGLLLLPFAFILHVICIFDAASGA